MGPLASLAAFVAALCLMYLAVKFLNSKRKKPSGPSVPRPTPTPLPVVDGITIGRRTYGLPVDGIYVNVLRVENGIVYYTFDTGENVPLIESTKEQFLAEFIPIIRVYRPGYRLPPEASDTQPK